MNIMFICSSLEFGRDGVGDYIRRIAVELIRQGNLIAVIAFNDKHITDKIIGVQQFSDIDLPVLRLPSIWNVKNRVKNAKEYVDEFDPAWLSLQFVPFGFHSKGLPFKLGNQLLLLGTGRRWHIMFHELWVGMAFESSIKQRYLGMVQKVLIKKLILNLKPKVINTQSRLYQAQLLKLGFKSEYLQLFGNIPLMNKDNGRTGATPADHRIISLVVFGTIHLQAPIKQFAQEVAAYAKEKKVQFLLKIIGRSGPEQDHWVDVWQSAGLLVEVLGEQPSEVISQLLKSALIGISTSAYVMIEKSGTVAAMREHDLPIICVSSSYRPRGIKDLPIPTGISEYKTGNFGVCLSKSASKFNNNNVNNIANQLTEFLTNWY
jgi:hypothetical protein